jgi:hypothetical protein
MFQLIVVLSFGSAGVFFLTRWYSDKQRQDRLEQSFYQLIQSNSGTVALIQLATVAQVDAALAKEYFDRQVAVLNAVPEVDDDGDMAYRFPKLNLPKSLPRQEEWDDEDDDWN